MAMKVEKSATNLVSRFQFMYLATYNNDQKILGFASPEQFKAQNAILIFGVNE